MPVRLRKEGTTETKGGGVSLRHIKQPICLQAAINTLAAKTSVTETGLTGGIEARSVKSAVGVAVKGSVQASVQALTERGFSWPTSGHRLIELEKTPQSNVVMVESESKMRASFV